MISDWLNGNMFLQFYQKLVFIGCKVFYSEIIVFYKTVPYFRCLILKFIGKWCDWWSLWLFLKSNAGKNKQFLILIPRHPRRCGDVRKLEKNLFGWGLFEKTEIYPLNEAKSWILQSLRHFLNKVVNWIFQSAWKEVV